MSMYDSIILGAGPAGITASIYAARKKMNFLVLTENIGGQTLWSADVENYTGYQMLTGPELTERFKDHLDNYDINVIEGVKAEKVEKKRNVFEVTIKSGEVYKAKTVIVATGRIPRRLGIKGEGKYVGKGLAYCATCDAPLYADAEVAVVGGGNSALDATLQLVKIAKKIHLIDRAPSLIADDLMVEKALQSGKVTVYNNAQVKEIQGDQFVSGIVIDADGKEKKIPVEGIFVEIGSIPASQMVPDVKKEKNGEVFVDCSCRTSVSGIYGAGDVTTVIAKQIIVACGEGAKAALSVFDYINTHKDSDFEE